MRSKIEQAKTRHKASDETFDEAVLLVENNSNRGAINRLYYSAFYIVSAYLILIDEEAATHKGAKQKFNQHLSASKLVSRDMAKAYNSLATIRNDTDYINFSEVPREKVLVLRDAVIELRSTIGKLIAELIKQSDYTE